MEATAHACMRSRAREMISNGIRTVCVRVLVFVIAGPTWSAARVILCSLPSLYLSPPALDTRHGTCLQAAYGSMRHVELQTNSISEPGPAKRLSDDEK